MSLLQNNLFKSADYLKWRLSTISRIQTTGLAQKHARNEIKSVVEILRIKLAYIHICGRHKPTATSWSSLNATCGSHTGEDVNSGLLNCSALRPEDGSSIFLRNVGIYLQVQGSPAQKANNGT